MAKGTQKKDNPISMRLCQEDADRFRGMAIEHGISQAKLLVKLMDEYESRPEEVELKSDLQIIEMHCYVSNDESASVTASVYPRFISFEGYTYVRPEKAYKVPFNARIAARLRAEFGLEIKRRNSYFDEFSTPNDDYGMYELENELHLYFHKKENRFLVHEIMSLSRKRVLTGDTSEGKTILDVSRCHFVENYYDVLKYFGNYAHPDNLRDISRLMAIDIEENYSLMDELFAD